jgi:hypothetical protein
LQLRHQPIDIGVAAQRDEARLDLAALTDDDSRVASLNRRDGGLLKDPDARSLRGCRET